MTKTLSIFHLLCWGPRRAGHSVGPRPGTWVAKPCLGSVLVKEVLAFGLHCVQWNVLQKKREKNAGPQVIVKPILDLFGKKKRYYCLDRHVSSLMKEDVNWFAREVKAFVSWIPVIWGRNCKNWLQGTSWPITSASVDLDFLLHLSWWKRERASFDGLIFLESIWLKSETTGTCNLKVHKRWQC